MEIVVRTTAGEVGTWTATTQTTRRPAVRRVSRYVDHWRVACTATGPAGVTASHAPAATATNIPAVKHVPRSRLVHKVGNKMRHHQRLR